MYEVKENSRILKDGTEITTYAKRGGGRVAGRSHIAPAEEAGIKELESEIERCLKNG